MLSSFFFLEVPSIPWLMAPSYVTKSHCSSLCSCHHISSSDSDLLLPSFLMSTFVFMLGPTRSSRIIFLFPDSLLHHSC